MIKRFKSFKQRDDGVAAVEFAIVSIPFFALIMSIIEIGIMFGAATILNGATEDAARLIRTGQAQGSGDARTSFEDKVCAELHMLFNCAELRYHVIALPDGDDFETAFSNPTILPPVVDTTNPNQLTASSFDPGKENDRVIVRVSYDYQLLTPLAPSFTNRPNNKLLLISTAILQNEPY